MAINIRPLPAELFSEPLRPHIKHLNLVLRDLVGLEGTIRQPRDSRRSDSTVARGEALQVHTSRITPSISEVVSGVSTAVGTPALTLGTANTVGSTTTAVSINSTIAFFDTTAPSALGSTAATGSVAFGARRDHQHIYPPVMRSTANASTLTLTDDATDQTLTGSLGLLHIVPNTGVRIDFPNSTSGQFVLAPNTTTAAATVGFIQGRPTAGTRTLLAPNWFSPAAGDTFSSQTFRCWDVQYATFAGQHTSDTIVGYDVSSCTISPSSGSSGSNNVYMFRNNALSIGNANATYSDVATAYFKGVRRVITSPLMDVQATVIIEPPTAGLSASDVTIGSSQIGIYIRQQTAQATAADRIAIKVDAQNSGTRRYAFYGVSDTIYHGGNIQHTGSRVGLYGATPTVVYGTTNTQTGHVAGSSTAVTVDSTFTGDTGSTAYTIGDIVRLLKLIGVATA